MNQQYGWGKCVNDNVYICNLKVEWKLVWRNDIGPFGTIIPILVPSLEYEPVWSLSEECTIDKECKQGITKVYVGAEGADIVYNYNLKGYFSREEYPSKNLFDHQPTEEELAEAATKEFFPNTETGPAPTLTHDGREPEEYREDTDCYKLRCGDGINNDADIDEDTSDADIDTLTDCADWKDCGGQVCDYREKIVYSRWGEETDTVTYRCMRSRSNLLAANKKGSPTATTTWKYDCKEETGSCKEECYNYDQGKSYNDGICALKDTLKVNGKTYTHLSAGDYYCENNKEIGGGPGKWCFCGKK
ncbi:MAG: hypothetical protein AABX71_00615 [Nanoarchaeota archaeon]